MPEMQDLDNDAEALPKLGQFIDDSEDSMSVPSEAFSS